MTRRLLRLAALLLLASMPSASMPSAMAQTGMPDGGTRLNPLSQIPLSSLTGFRDRPLFSPSRTRPDDLPPSDAEAVPDAAIAAPAEADVKLLGVVITPDGATARVLDMADNSAHSLAIGDTLGNWTVESVDPTGMVIRDGDRTQALTVFRDPSSAPPQDHPPASSPDDDPIIEVTPTPE